MPHDVRIEVGGHGTGSIVVGDSDLSRAVRSFTLDSEVGCRPVLCLELLVHDVSTLSQADIYIPEDTAAALVALGWSPPPGQEIADAPAHG
ncbi:hypothetical protein [Streptomyces sp. NRRL B-24720]|uniref:hypothetical protein n=1 Tax=Streptomyces sp. NRRL B-24720 TaxID=1476876 RepID=UPI0004C7218C|nr:hypothetical protein [Streptomyces sp. NRRL B-24720]